MKVAGYKIEFLWNAGPVPRVYYGSCFCRFIDELFK